MDKVLFNKISIIQSLKNSDFHSGTKLKEDLEGYNNAFKGGLNIELFDIFNQTELFNVFDKLIIDATNNLCYPILQIETHGSPNQQGLILASDEYISWSTLKPKLIELNVATRLNLLFVCSSCHGAHFTKHLVPHERAPCWGLIGPTKALSGDKLLYDFSRFYRSFFESGSGGVALKNLIRIRNPSEDNSDYSCTNAADFFKIVYSGHIEKYCTKKGYRKRARRLREEFKNRAKKEFKNGDGEKPKTPSKREFFLTLQSTQRDFFEKYKRKYFMIDLFPDNEFRFKIKYQDVIQAKG